MRSPPPWTPTLALLLALAGTAAGRPVPEWTLELGSVTVSPLRLADVNLDGTGDIIVATMGPPANPFSAGAVHVLDTEGAELPGWPVLLGNNQPIAGASVAAGDLDGNGDIELVVEGWFFLHVWNHDGTPLAGWPRSTGTTATASPALGDLDGDGDLEIVVPHGPVMHAWRFDGTELPGWPRSASENFQAPSVGDFDGDGALEVTAGTWRPQFPDTVPFELHMWQADGTPVPGFPVGGLGSVRGPVSLGDVDGDGAVEIALRAGDTLRVLDLAGAPEPGWPIAVPDAIRNATPALGDLDGDGDLEIVIGGFDVHAYHHDGSPVKGFPVEVGATGNINSSAIIVSIDADGATPEVLVKFTNNVAGLLADGTAVPGFPYALPDDNQSATFSPSPAAGDLDGDGDVEYAFASVSGRVHYFDEPEPWSAAASPWPLAQRDLANSSFIPPARSSCPWDCGGGAGDGTVGIGDLLALLAQWGAAGPCDFDGGGAGIADLLELLARWGPCR